jgi:hypothetical protein
MADLSRADRVGELSGEGGLVPPPDVFHCKHCGAAVPGAFRLRGEPPQLNVPVMEAHLHRQHREDWQRLTAKVHSSAQLPAALAEAFESPVVDPKGRDGGEARSLPAQRVMAAQSRD